MKSWEGHGLWEPTGTKLCRNSWCGGEWSGIPSKVVRGNLTALSLLRGVVRGSEVLAFLDQCCRAWCSFPCTSFLKARFLGDTVPVCHSLLLQTWIPWSVLGAEVSPSSGD